MDESALPIEEDKLLASVRPPIAELPEAEPEDALLEQAGILAATTPKELEDIVPEKIIVEDNVPHHPRVDDLRRARKRVTL